MRSAGFVNVAALVAALRSAARTPVRRSPRISVAV
jgi:hypothetical protein